MIWQCANVKERDGTQHISGTQQQQTKSLLWIGLSVSFPTIRNLINFNSLFKHVRLYLCFLISVLSLFPSSTLCFVFSFSLLIYLSHCSIFLLLCLLSVSSSFFILTAIHPTLLPLFYMYAHKYIIVILPFVSFFLPVFNFHFFFLNFAGITDVLSSVLLKFSDIEARKTIQENKKWKVAIRTHMKQIRTKW